MAFVPARRGNISLEEALGILKLKASQAQDPIEKECLMIASDCLKTTIESLQDRQKDADDKPRVARAGEAAPAAAGANPRGRRSDYIPYVG